MKKVIITSILFGSLMLTSAYVETLAPDGTHVGGNSAELAPDGSYVGK